MNRLTEIDLVKVTHGIGNKTRYELIYNQRELSNGILPKLTDVRQHLIIKTLFDKIEDLDNKKVLDVLKAIKMLL